MPTMSSVGEWKISSALCRCATRSISICSATSSRNSRRIVNGRPASRTSTSPCSRMAPTWLLEQAGDMGGVGRRGDRHHAARICDAVRGRQHGGAAQAVADQERGRRSRLAQMIGGGHQVVDVGRKMRVGEFALAAAQPGEVEAQHRDAVRRQPLGDRLGGAAVLAAGEAMREQREGGRLAQRQVEHRRQFLAFAIGKLELLAAHGMFLARVAVLTLDPAWCDERLDAHREAGEGQTLLGAPSLGSRFATLRARHPRRGGDGECIARSTDFKLLRPRDMPLA